jgi:ABC-type multidrug transport system fused ATPase/permease subunit
VISSVKASFLFVCISELEVRYLDLLFVSRNEEPTNAQQDNEAEQRSTRDLEASVHPNEVNYLKSLKTLFQSAIVVVSFASFVFMIVKLGLMLNQMKNNDNKLPVDLIYFVSLIISVAFTLIELILAFLSWFFLNRLSHTSFSELTESSLSSDNDKKKSVNLKRLFSLSKPELHLLSLGFIALCFSSATQVVAPYFFGQVIDAAEKYEDLAKMNMAVLTMFMAYVIGSVASGFRSWLFERAGARVVARLRKDVFSAILRQDIKFFDSNRTGELTSRISSDTQVIQNAVTVNISMLLRYVIQIFGSLIFMFTLQASLTGLLLAIIPVVSLSAVIYGRYLKRLRKEFQDKLAAAGVTAEEGISSVRTVRSFGAENKIIEAYDKDIMQSFRIAVRLAVTEGGFMFFIGIVVAGAISLVLWYGGKLVHDHTLSTGVLTSFLMYTLQTAMAFTFLISLYGDFMQSVGASQRIFELMDSKSEIALDKGIEPENEIDSEKIFDGSIRFNNITFAYPTRKETNVLKNLSFEIEKGKSVALVGSSGGGKSTIFALIQRFYDPDDGEIMIGSNAHNLKDINLNFFHSKIGTVSQEPVLFGGSIRDNIKFSSKAENISEEEIHEVAKLANAHGFIMDFEQGYDTIVGERGVRLSGGQKQRISIARALLVNPKLLLLDEATSALDAESEHLVQEALYKAMKNRTVCVIAHRLSTVRDADLVIVLDGGRIVQKGTHDELIKVDGVYKQLVLRQMMTDDKHQQAAVEQQTPLV